MLFAKKWFSWSAVVQTISNNFGTKIFNVRFIATLSFYVYNFYGQITKFMYVIQYCHLEYLKLISSWIWHLCILTWSTKLIIFCHGVPADSFHNIHTKFCYPSKSYIDGVISAYGIVFVNLFALFKRAEKSVLF